MKLLQLIERLERELRQHGDIDVLLTVSVEAEEITGDGTVTLHNEPSKVETEQDHTKETMFVRITADPS